MKIYIRRHFNIHFKDFSPTNTLDKQVKASREKIRAGTEKNRVIFFQIWVHLGNVPGLPCISEFSSVTVQH